MTVGPKRKCEPDLVEASPTWPHVLEFAQEMERKLSLHRDRGNRDGWLIETPLWLFNRMLTEVIELGAALGLPVSVTFGRANPDGQDPGQECADVANLAMMLRDRVRVEQDERGQ